MTAKVPTQAVRIAQLEKLTEDQERRLKLGEGVLIASGTRLLALEARVLVLEQQTPPVEPHEPPTGARADAIDLAAAVLTPGDVRGWPITSPITRLELRPDGLTITFSKQDGANRWPDVTPAGWTGPVQYTVWAGAPLGGVVHLAASWNWYFGEPPANGGPVTDPTHFPRNVWYLDRALAAYTPTVGAPLLLMVTAGGWRGIDARSVEERSQVVAVPMPGPAGAVYTF